MVMVVGLALLPESIHGDPERQLMLMGGILLWGTRLTVNWASGWTGIDHEDWRYTMFRKRYPTPVFEFINLFGLHGFPTVMVFAGLTGAIVAFGDPTPAGTPRLGRVLGHLRRHVVRAGLRPPARPPPPKRVHRTARDRPVALVPSPQLLRGSARLVGHLAVGHRCRPRALVDRTWAGLHHRDVCARVDPDDGEAHGRPP